jgi:hypothetical protein
MARRIGLAQHTKQAIGEIARSLRYYKHVSSFDDYSLSRWSSQMVAVDIHAVWERYAEKRLVIALNHNPDFFIKRNHLKGIRKVPAGLASYVVRSGGKFFDFRSMNELTRISKLLIAPEDNPFRVITEEQRSYIECLAAIRNRIAHRSEASEAAYRNQLRSVFSLRFCPETPEFLNSLDSRRSSPARGRPRIFGIATMVAEAIRISTVQAENVQ